MKLLVMKLQCCDNDCDGQPLLPERDGRSGEKAHRERDKSTSLARHMQGDYSQPRNC